jgi:hypothetical protein
MRHDVLNSLDIHCIISDIKPVETNLEPFSKPALPYVVGRMHVPDL